MFGAQTLLVLLYSGFKQDITKSVYPNGSWVKVSDWFVFFNNNSHPHFFFFNSSLVWFLTTGALLSLGSNKLGLFSFMPLFRLRPSWARSLFLLLRLTENDLLILFGKPSREQSGLHSVLLARQGASKPGMGGSSTFDWERGLKDLMSQPYLFLFIFPLTIFLYSVCPDFSSSFLYCLE